MKLGGIIKAFMNSGCLPSHFHVQAVSFLYRLSLSALSLSVCVEIALNYLTVISNCIGWFICADCLRELARPRLLCIWNKFDWLSGIGSSAVEQLLLIM